MVIPLWVDMCMVMPGEVGKGVGYMGKGVKGGGGR